MSAVWLSAAFALFIWWFGTGAVLLMGRAPRMLSAGLAVGLAVTSFWLAWATKDAQTVSAAFGAFAAGVGMWGFHEAVFLAGAVTGPRRSPCPPGARGWRRFRLAAATLIHHEIALALTALGLVALLWSSPNPVAAWTFVVLWALRLSVKFNIYLGAPNVADEFLPDGLRYLSTYFSPRPMNALFPVSVTVGTVAAGGLILHAATVAETAFHAAGLSLVGVLTALGVLEHWFLVLPLREAALWRMWTRRDNERAEGALRMSAGRPAAGR